MSDPFRKEYRQLSDEEKLRVQEVKTKAQPLYDCIESLGQSRELSLAKTKLEEAIMWATKHIT